MAMGERVNVAKGQRPKDYHCACKYCRKAIGELIQPDGSYYSRLERRQYYDPSEKGKGGHIAKTPLHIARWAVQEYTKPGEWVIDPTIGAGTTAVEAITQGRSVAGMELEYGKILEKNIALSIKTRPAMRAIVGAGDARKIGAFLKKSLPKGVKFSLFLNNPPYFGDISMPSPKGKLRGKEHRHLETRFDYDKDLPNLAFLKEGEEYWETMRKIYLECFARLRVGGHAVVGIKDMMRNKEPYTLHENFCEMLDKGMGLQFVGTAFLRHYPGTLFLNSCEKIHGVKPPFYQTISVFKKVKDAAV